MGKNREGRRTLGTGTQEMMVDIRTVTHTQKDSMNLSHRQERQMAYFIGRSWFGRNGIP